MKGCCDLHNHSYYSDGTCSPEQLLQKASRLGLSAIALTDHNTVAGLPEFLKAGEKYPVETIAGAEFTSEFEGQELHILGLHIQPEYFDFIEETMVKIRALKEKSERALVKRLQERGMNISYEQLSTATRDGNVNRAHIAAEMIRKGYVETTKEAFATWLSETWGLYRPAKRPDALQVVRAIKSIGAVAILAHPFLSMKEEQLRRFLDLAIPCGLDGMETFYSKYDQQTTKLALSIAREYDILPSGGSDYHGDNKPGIFMGVGKGNLRIPMEIAEAMVERIETEIKNKKTVDFYETM